MAGAHADRQPQVGWRAALRRLDDSRLGDALGALALFAWLGALLLIGAGLS
jgi:hypothetical protein